MIGKFTLRPKQISPSRDPDALLGEVDFHREVARERLRAARRAIPFCVITIDLADSRSRIKPAQRGVLKILRRHVRFTDYKAQFHPRRYAVLLVDTPEMGGRAALDRIQTLLESRGIQASLTLQVHDPEGFHSNDIDTDGDSRFPEGQGRRGDDRDDSFAACGTPWSAVEFGDSETDGVACIARPPRTLRSDSNASAALSTAQVATLGSTAPRSGDTVCQSSVRWSLGEDTSPLSRLRRWNKRTLDMIGAMTGLVLLGPIFLITAMAIKLTSAGPIFFRQVREGKDGRPFVILKFRTMVVDAEQFQQELQSASHRDGPAFKVKDDPRVTTVGRFLRKTCIDELPQLINVLRGEMSLVGPRPLPWHESRACDSWHRRRLVVKPGMTCHWQIDKTAAPTFDDWMRLDLQYVDRGSTWQDLHLIARTTVVPMTGRGSD